MNLLSLSLSLTRLMEATFRSNKAFALIVVVVVVVCFQILSLCVSLCVGSIFTEACEYERWLLVCESVREIDR